MSKSSHQDQSGRMHTNFWRIIGLLILLMSFVLAHIYEQPLLNLINGQASTTQITPPPCDLNRQSCLLPLMTPVASESPWTFAILPRPIPVSAPLTFILTPPVRILAPNQPETVWVDLTGDSMDMGVIRIPLTQSSDGHWQGRGSIPVCVTGQMRWRARLHMQLERTLLQADWLFTAPLSTAAHRLN